MSERRALALPALQQATVALRGLDWSPSRESALSLMRGAELALEEDDSAERAVQVKDVLKFMQQQFRRRGAKLVEGNLLAAQRLKTEHELGARLDRDGEDGTRAGKGEGRSNATRSSIYTLPDIGVSSPDAVRFRRIGSLAWADLEALIRAELDKGEQGAELSTAWALGVWRQFRQPTEPVWPELPAGIFNLLYADPPWQYEFSESPANRSIENQYPTATVAQMCDETFVADLRAHTAPDAMLFLWATSPKLTEAQQLLTAWGFEYRTNLVWVKDRIGMGYYVRQQHELLLVAKRGNLPVPAEADRVSSVIEAPRGRHSEKPEQVYGMLEGMYPAAERLELFARTARPGWTPWGNEVDDGASVRVGGAA